MTEYEGLGAKAEIQTFGQMHSAQFCFKSNQWVGEVCEEYPSVPKKWWEKNFVKFITMLVEMLNK